MARSQYLPSMRPRSNWMFFALLIPVLACILGFGGVYSYIWVPVNLTLGIVVLLTLWLRLLHGENLGWHPVWIPVLLFGLLITAQWSLHWSVYPGTTLTSLLQLTGCASALFLALCVMRHPFNLVRLGNWIWLFTAFLASEALVQYFTAHRYIYWFHNATYAKPVGPYVYRNHFAGCMDLLIPIATFMAFNADSSHESPWLLWLRRGIVPALALSAIIISESRGGIFALGLEFLLAMLLLQSLMQRKRKLRVLLGVAVAELILFIAVANLGPVINRISHMRNHDPNLITRLQVSLSCIHIFRQHPWVGTGMGTFASVYPAYETFDDGMIWLYAHNDFAQALAETGLTGMFCVLVFLAIWGYSFGKLARMPDRTFPQNLQLAIFVGMTGFLFHSLGDFQFHAPANALLFFTLAGAGLSRSDTHTGSEVAFSSAHRVEPFRPRRHSSVGHLP